MRVVKGWLLFIATVIVLGVSAYCLYLVRDMLPFLGLLIYGSLAFLIVLFNIFAIIFVVRFFFKNEVHAVGSHGSVVSWMGRITKVHPMLVEESRPVNVIPARISARGYPGDMDRDEPEPEEDTYTVTEVGPLELPPPDGELEMAAREYNNGYNSRNKLAKRLSELTGQNVSTYKTIQLIAALKESGRIEKK